MKNVPENELFSAYLDGELTAAEEVEVERLLRESPAARQLLDELRTLSNSLQALPTRKLGEDLVPHVLRQAERRILAGPADQADPANLPTPASRDATSPIGDASEPWWSWRRRLSPRNLSWSIMAVVTAILVMIATDRRDDAPDDRQLAMHPQGENTEAPTETPELKTLDDLDKGKYDKTLGITDGSVLTRTNGTTTPGKPGHGDGLVDGGLVDGRDRIVVGKSPDGSSLETPKFNDFVAQRLAERNSGSLPKSGSGNIARTDNDTGSPAGPGTAIEGKLGATRDGKSGPPPVASGYGVGGLAYSSRGGANLTDGPARDLLARQKLSSGLLAAQQDGGVMIVQCTITHEAAESAAFRDLLAKNSIVWEDDGRERERGERSSSQREAGQKKYENGRAGAAERYAYKDSLQKQQWGYEQWNEHRGFSGGAIQMVAVEATPEQIEATLTDLARHPETFLSVNVQGTPGQTLGDALHSRGTYQQGQARREKSAEELQQQRFLKSPAGGELKSDFDRLGDEEMRRGGRLDDLRLDERRELEEDSAAGEKAEEAGVEEEEKQKFDVGGQGGGGMGGGASALDLRVGNDVVGGRSKTRQSQAPTKPLGRARPLADAFFNDDGERRSARGRYYAAEEHARETADQSGADEGTGRRHNTLPAPGGTSTMPGEEAIPKPGETDPFEGNRKLGEDLRLTDPATQNGGRPLPTKETSPDNAPRSDMPLGGINERPPGVEQPAAPPAPPAPTTRPQASTRTPEEPAPLEPATAEPAPPESGPAEMPAPALPGEGPLFIRPNDPAVPVAPEQPGDTPSPRPATPAAKPAEGEPVEVNGRLHKSIHDVDAPQRAPQPVAGHKPDAVKGTGQAGDFADKEPADRASSEAESPAQSDPAHYFGGESHSGLKIAEGLEETGGWYREEAKPNATLGTKFGDLAGGERPVRALFIFHVVRPPVAAQIAAEVAEDAAEAVRARTAETATLNREAGPAEASQPPAAAAEAFEPPAAEPSPRQ